MTNGPAPATLSQLVALARAANRRPVIACAAADNAATLEAVAAAIREHIATAILVGDEARIRALGVAAGMPAGDWRVEDVPDPVAASFRAVQLCREGEAQALMKGRVGTGTFLRAVLDSIHGVRGSGILSHVTVFEPPVAGRLMLLADAGVNIAPDVTRKIAIIRNSVELARDLGIPRPRVALLAALEYEQTRMPATSDAAAIVQSAQSAELPPCVVGGPYSLDVAVSPDAAATKGIDDEVAGRADVLIAPDIEAGNILYKSLSCFAQVDLASLVLGAAVPLIVASRADSARAKLYSIALGVYSAVMNETPAHIQRAAT